MDFSFLSKILGEDVIELYRCSRLEWKNIVYCCVTISQKKYAIKIYYENDFLESRATIEYEMYKILKSLDIQIPNIIFFGKINKKNILITEWIEGNSLKELVSKNGVKKNEIIIKNYLNYYNKIWNYKASLGLVKILKKNRLENCINPSMIQTRANIGINKLFSKFKFNKEVNYIEKIYNDLRKKIKVSNNVINSDISLHEFILKKDNKNGFIIDLESFTIGDVNNDLAGIFYSLSNSIIEYNVEIQYLFNILSSNVFFDVKKFIFYLIERVFCANYLDNINEREINYYCKFIIDLYQKYTII